ncbi:hypothetical protein BDD43_2337 [Mucilaginibacter gracilis]|uniref:Uncharacterized protein n=2 Tax=Mucilaginibacter gracilis TaxID=423350 RepID=A0A495IZP7_9SPHI|nr:hypothetical protein BDD43_2337 [Mucilaginibacter gracilis]
MINQYQAILIVLMLLTCFKTNAQQKILKIPLNAGKTYLKVTVIKSESHLQNGQVKINISSAATVSKTYKIEAGTGGLFDVTVVTNKITNSIASGNDQFYFDSDSVVNSKSVLATAIASTVGKPYVFQIDSGGAIASVKTDYPKAAIDTVFGFTGLEQEDLSVGKKFPLIADIRSLKNLKIGEKWSDPALTANGETVTEFWIQSRAETVTTIAFSKTITNLGLNTQSTGTYVVDNITGVIMQRKVQNFTTGYQTLKNTSYVSSRSSTITENCSVVN